MSSSHRRYSREFKLEVVRRVDETGRTQAQVSIMSCIVVDDVGVACSREHVARLMRKYGLRSRHYRRPKRLTKVDRCRAAAPNLVGQYF